MMASGGEFGAGQKRNNNQLIQEKPLTIATDSMIASQLFEYKNQVEVKAVFIPLLKTTAAFHAIMTGANNPAFSPVPTQLLNNRTSTKLVEDGYAKDALKRASYGQSPERRDASKTMSGQAYKTMSG